MLAAVVLFALNLRGPLVAISTVTTDLNTDLGMSSTAIGLLTSLPVLCFGLAAPGASSLIARTGVERSVLLSLLGVLVGVLVRSLGGVPAALAGTVIMGLAITIGNVVVPVIIGRDFRGRVAAITGTYTATMNVGSMIALTVTGPLAEAFGWQFALAFNAVFPLLAATVWVPLSRRRSPHRPAADSAAQFMLSADMIFTQKFFPADQTGFYAAAGMIGRALVFFTQPLTLVMFPKVARSVATGEKSNALMLALGRDDFRGRLRGDRLHVAALAAVTDHL